MSTDSVVFSRVYYTYHTHTEPGVAGAPAHRLWRAEYGEIRAQHLRHEVPRDSWRAHRDAKEHPHQTHEVRYTAPTVCRVRCAVSVTLGQHYHACRWLMFRPFPCLWLLVLPNLAYYRGEWGKAAISGMLSLVVFKKCGGRDPPPPSATPLGSACPLAGAVRCCRLPARAHLPTPRQVVLGFRWPRLRLHVADRLRCQVVRRRQTVCLRRRGGPGRQRQMDRVQAAGRRLLPVRRQDSQQRNDGTWHVELLRKILQVLL